MSAAVLAEDVVLVRAADLDTHEHEIAFWRTNFAGRLHEDTCLHAQALLEGRHDEVERLAQRIRTSLSAYDAALAGDWTRSATDPAIVLQQAAVNARRALDLAGDHAADHDRPSDPLLVPCPHCADGFVDDGDRHARTAKDVCSACGGTHQVPANTGTTPEASFDPAAALEAADGRDTRQEQMRRWITRIWGEGALHPHERIERLLEETIELAQAEQLPVEQIASIAAHVYAKDPGEPAQEIGGISTCLLAYCASRSLSADACERTELTRILGKTIEHFRARHQAKVDAGMAKGYAIPDDGAAA